MRVAGDEVGEYAQEGHAGDQQQHGAGVSPHRELPQHGGQPQLQLEHLHAVGDGVLTERDRVEVEDSLITLESDKATMEIPSPRAGVVAEVTVQLGDQVSEGSMLLTLEVEGAEAEDAQSPGPAAGS